MLIAEILSARLAAGFETKTHVAKVLGVSRPTLDGWLEGRWVPAPDRKNVTRIAEWVGCSESKVLAMILIDQGFDLEDLVNLAKGVYVGSLVTV